MIYDDTRYGKKLQPHALAFRLPLAFAFPCANTPEKFQCPIHHKLQQDDIEAVFLDQHFDPKSLHHVLLLLPLPWSTTTSGKIGDFTKPIWVLEFENKKYRSEIPEPLCKRIS